MSATRLAGDAATGDGYLMKMEVRYLPMRCTDLERSQHFYGKLASRNLACAATNLGQYQLGGAELCVDLEHDEPGYPGRDHTVDDLQELAKLIRLRRY